MNNLEKKIINELLDKYERSNQSINIDSKKRKISLKTDKDKLFSCYFGEEAYLYRDELETIVKNLELQNFVKCNFDKTSNLLKEVVLNIQNLQGCFQFVNRIPKNSIDNLYIEKMEDLKSSFEIDSIAYKYVNNMILLLKEHKPHLSYFSTFDDVILNASIVNAIEKNKEEILLRNFSKQVTKDSKMIERSQSGLLKIFNEFGEEQYDNFNELLTTHFIVKNIGYVYVKNGLCFSINDQIVDLDKMNIDFSLSSKAIEMINIVSINKDKIITIENLTTFNYYNDDNAVIIYLGGFHNSTKRMLIQKIHNYNPKLQWYHFGDIDWGGFEIFIDLVNKTGINFLPLNMGIEQLIKYKKDCLPLSDNDRKKLNLLLLDKNASIFKDVIQFMLENNYKLEQESIE